MSLYPCPERLDLVDPVDIAPFLPYRLTLLQYIVLIRLQ